MNTAQELEQSWEDGQPVYFYQFERDAQDSDDNLTSAYWRYNSSDRDLTVGGYLWEAAPIDFSEIQQGAERQKLNISVVVPIGLDVIDNWLPNPPSSTIGLTIFEGQYREVPNIQAVTLIPSTGSFAYATQPYTRRLNGVAAKVENVHTVSGDADVTVALDQLFKELRHCNTISVVVAQFGDDLRAGECQIKPRLAVGPDDQQSVSWTPNDWTVDSVTPQNATLVTYVNDSAGGHSVYGSTPSDVSIQEVIQYLKSKGKRIIFYPFVLMDVPTGNTLPNPYGGTGQPVNPWRGRITCYPAPGTSGTVDATAAAAAQITNFFTREWGFNRFIRHYIGLCSPYFTTGDVFIIGTEMVGITQVRSDRTTYPAVAYLRSLAAEVKSAMPNVLVSYAADWTEYHSRQYSNGDLNFHLDPLWADSNVDFVGIDNYFPIADVRDTDSNLLNYDLDYLKSNIEGGELYDWYYEDRANNVKRAITDGGYGKPWVYRQKDVRSWWGNPHVARQEYTETTATPWVPGSKPIWFTEYGCPAINRGSNQPNVFYDPQSSESALPYFSTGARDDLAQRCYYAATLDYWRENGGEMISTANMVAWTWDARPYPQFPDMTSEWGDYANYQRGHWLQGRSPDDSLAIWIGRVLVPSFGIKEVTFSCEPTVTTAARSGLNQAWQKGCMHVLYKQGLGLCNAKKENFRITATITLVSGNVATAAAFSSLAAGRLAGGYLEWRSAEGYLERMTIVSHTGSDVSFYYSPTSLPAGTVVTAYPGCDHTYADCNGYFNNGPNYGGDLYAPERSPFDGYPVY